eukprot:COSAG04_NODE_1218_length_7708_cov_1.979629_2_plen_80_part_00
MPPTYAPEIVHLGDVVDGANDAGLPGGGAWSSVTFAGKGTAVCRDLVMRAGVHYAEVRPLTPLRGNLAPTETCLLSSKS